MPLKCIPGGSTSNDAGPSARVSEHWYLQDFVLTFNCVARLPRSRSQNMHCCPVVTPSSSCGIIVLCREIDQTLDCADIFQLLRVFQREPQTCQFARL